MTPWYDSSTFGSSEQKQVLGADNNSCSILRQTLNRNHSHQYIDASTPSTPASSPWLLLVHCDDHPKRTQNKRRILAAAVIHIQMISERKFSHDTCWAFRLKHQNQTPVVVDILPPPSNLRLPFWSVLEGLQTHSKSQPCLLIYIINALNFTNQSVIGNPGICSGLTSNILFVLAKTVSSMDFPVLLTRRCRHFS